MYKTLGREALGEVGAELDEARKRAIGDRKTLIFASPADRRIAEPLYPLQMDDASYMLFTFGLQRDSEFLQAFNYYLLKAYEHGILKKIHRKYHMHQHVNEQFGMPEPQPLSWNNVMFPLVCLGIGIVTSATVAAAEFVLMKKI